MPEVSRNLLLFVGLIWNHLIVMEFQRSSEDRNHRGGEAGVKKIQYKLVGKAYWCIGCVCVCVCVGGGVIHSKLIWVLGVTKEYLTELPTFDPVYQK